jgi:hypothetical protein
MTCPKCGSSDIRASKSSHWSDLFQHARGREPLRCRKCRQRFFSSEPSLSDAKRIAPWKRRPAKHKGVRRSQSLARKLIVITTFAVAGLLFWFFLRYLTTERSTPPDSGEVNLHLPWSLS